MKLFLFSLIAALFLCSCEQNSNESLNEKFINIYKMEIKMKLSEMKELTVINPVKYMESYSEIKEVQRKFDLIYSLVEKNDLNINSLLKEIYNQTKKHYKYNMAKKLDIILNTNTNAIKRKELEFILLELNSTIISQIHDDVDRTDYKFNKINVFVIPEKKVIKLGDTYKAYTVIGAIDTTAIPTITYENQSRQLESSSWIIQIKGEKRGKFISKGNLELTRSEDGIKKMFPFEFEFEVK
jgi:hypothetical protein